MIIFFEKFERYLVGNKRHTKCHKDVNKMFVEIEIIRRLCKHSGSDFRKGKRKRFVNTHAVDGKDTYDDEQCSK